MTYAPYSDFALHHMGAGLADGITQGAAGPDQFRTADLMQAIEDHYSSGRNCVGVSSSSSTGGGFNQTCASEANQVINSFNRLNSTAKQDVLDFLRSL